jgi:argininosuccinate lyase
MKKKLWGGRFSTGTDDAVEKFSHSLSFDRRLARYDILGSIAHARMLGKTRIIPAADSKRLVSGLQALLKEAARGKLRLDESSEDIHTAIQLALEKKAGASVERLHSARSRNDQVVTAFRLYSKEKLRELIAAVTQLQKKILAQADATKNLVMPGYTHIRHAQPLVVGHLLVSYVVMLERDKERLQGALSRIDELPLGSGALTGSGLPIDRAFVAKQLGFARVAENSVDAVTERDFAAEILSVASILGLHLSRIAEDLMLWSTAEFGFVQFGEQMLTGSSMMPQKQNPDFLELTRAGSAKVLGDLSGMFALLKALPSGYQRDLQLDKEILFGGIDRIEGMLAVMTAGFGALHWNKRSLNTQLNDESLYATDLAEYLVAKGESFAQAHKAVGKLLSYADKKGIALKSVPLGTLQGFSKRFDKKFYGLLDPAVSVRRKKSAGSTNPAQVAQAIRRWKTKLKG